MLLIPDNAAAGADSQLELSGSGTIAAIRIHADVIHTHIGDLTIAVISPAGRRIVLRDRAGGGADDLHETWTPATTPTLGDLVGEPLAAGPSTSPTTPGRTRAASTAAGPWWSLGGSAPWACTHV